EMNIAEQLDPLSAEVQGALGRILFYSGKTDEAVIRVKRAIDMEPRSAGAHGLLADIYTEMDRHTEALALYDKARILRGNPPDNPPFPRHPRACLRSNGQAERGSSYSSRPHE